MYRLRKKGIFSVIAVMIAVFCIAATAAVFADDADYTDNDEAVKLIAGSSEYSSETMSEEDAENYRTAASTFIDNYSENVGGEDFTENLDKALIAKRDDVRPYATWLALLPPIIAIALALITKEVYSSLFIGILAGALLYSNFSLRGTIASVLRRLYCGGCGCV